MAESLTAGPDRVFKREWEGTVVAAPPVRLAMARGHNWAQGWDKWSGGTTIVTVVVGTWLGSMGRRCMPLLSGSVRRVEVDDVVSSRNQLG